MHYMRNYTLCYGASRATPGTLPKGNATGDVTQHLRTVLDPLGYSAFGEGIYSNRRIIFLNPAFRVARHIAGVITRWCYILEGGGVGIERNRISAPPLLLSIPMLLVLWYING